MIAPGNDRSSRGANETGVRGRRCVGGQTGLFCACNRLGYSLLTAGLLTSGAFGAELRLPEIFGHNMVLQRGQPVRVWGEGRPGAGVQVRIGDQSGIAHAGADGHWQVALDPVVSGGPYTLTVSADGKRLTLTNVLCGDVWLCSGQSNMQWPVKDVDPAEQKVALVDRPNLRLCSVAKAPSAQPLDSAKMQWAICTPESVRTFSAVASFFAIELLDAPSLTNIPIGVIDSSFGGTTCEGWIPEPSLTNFAAKDLHDSMFGIKPAQLYNGMIAPLGHSAFKGVLWYQGESNSAHPETYPALLAVMAGEWRKQFGQPDLPFLVVQLPAYANLWEGFYWPWIREMQALAVHSISNTALVVTLETTDGFNLHPKEKREIGRRSALLARRVAYGESLVARGPVFRDATVNGSTVCVKFDTAGDGLATATRSGVRGFAVAGADGVYHFADAKIEGESVVVRSDGVFRPETVRYAWAAMPRGTLVNKSGLPAAPFRTDQLPCSNVEIQAQQITRRVATSAYEIVIDANGMATSLVVHGAQFLSNEPGADGGGNIPGFWGARALTTIREIGPRLLSCSDDEVAVQMAFDETSMQWSFTNRGTDPITFQLALSPHVRAPDSLIGGKVTLTRGSAALTLTGFDSITNTPAGAKLISHIKAGAANTIFLK